MGFYGNFMGFTGKLTELMGKSPFFMGKLRFFLAMASIATLVYQRVTGCQRSTLEESVLSALQLIDFNAREICGKTIGKP